MKLIKTLNSSLLLLLLLLFSGCFHSAKKEVFNQEIAKDSAKPQKEKMIDSTQYDINTIEPKTKQKKMNRYLTNNLSFLSKSDLNVVGIRYDSLNNISIINAEVFDYACNFQVWFFLNKNKENKYQNIYFQSCDSEPSELEKVNVYESFESIPKGLVVRYSEYNSKGESIKKDTIFSFKVLSH